MHVDDTEEEEEDGKNCNNCMNRTLTNSKESMPFEILLLPIHRRFFLFVFHSVLRSSGFSLCFLRGLGKSNSFGLESEEILERARKKVICRNINRCVNYFIIAMRVLHMYGIGRACV